MRILGLSAFHRDAAAALVVDGVPVAAAQEERFSKKRLDPALPKRALRHCLDAEGVLGRDLDYVVFYEKPLRKFERLLATQLRAFPKSAKVFSKNMFLWLGDRLWIKARLAEEIGIDPAKIMFVEQQLSHAASAFYTSPFEESAVLAVDDVGEWATTLLARGSGRELEPLAELLFPHSLGMFASAVTQFLGFEPGADEHKVEDLAAWGEPRFVDALTKLVQPKEAGGFSVDTEPFRFSFDSDVLFGSKLAEILGEHRIPGSPLRYDGEDRRDADVAASLQAVLEERTLALCAELFSKAPSENLCFAGALAQNRRLNARLLVDGPFKNLHVPPAPGKAGAALGAALYAHHVFAGGERGAQPKTTFLGSSIDGMAEEGARLLAGRSEATDELVRRLAAGESVAWVRGAMEFGPRGLGHRALLADPRKEDARERLLNAVQRSEPFLSCPLAVCAERVADLFELPSGGEGLARLGHLVVRPKDAARAAAPSAAAHDGLVWIMAVEQETDPEFHELLTRFGKESGAPLLLCDSFHLRGSPLVRNEVDAVQAFERSGLDALVVEERLYSRS